MIQNMNLIPEKDYIDICNALKERITSQEPITSDQIANIIKNLTVEGIDESLFAEIANKIATLLYLSGKTIVRYSTSDESNRYICGQEIINGQQNIIPQLNWDGEVIGSYAFCQSNIQKYICPNTTIIGSYSFYNPRPLYNIPIDISIPHLKEIREGAFSECTFNYDFFKTVPELTYIGPKAFYNCNYNYDNKKITLNIPNHVTIIGEEAFKYDKNDKVNNPIQGFTVINLPGGEVRDKAFENNTSLTTVTGYPKLISYRAFASCYKLNDVSHLSPIRIGRAAFKDCENLTHISFERLKELEQEAFQGCPLYDSPNLPQLKRIYENSSGSHYGGAFEKCKFTTVNFPNLEEAGTSTFSNCKSLISANLPKVKIIPDTLFSNCTSLKEIRVSSELSKIGDSSFSNCSSLTTLPPELLQVKEMGRWVFSNCSSLQGELTFPNLIKDGQDVFENCPNITGISLPQLTLSIGGFKNCSSLIHINAPLIKAIGSEAFYGCSSLTTLPDNFFQLENIYSGAFAFCPNLQENLDFPNLKAISSESFKECTNLKMFSAPKATGVGRQAFENCTSLKTLSIPSANSIGAGAFAGCTSLETLDILSATSIEESAFNGCSSLTLLNAPLVDSINYNTFVNCNSLTLDNINTADIQTLSILGFENNQLIQELNFPNLQTLILDYAPHFDEKSHIGTNIVLPSDHYVNIKENSSYYEPGQVTVSLIVNSQEAAEYYRTKLPLENYPDINIIIKP